MTPTDHLCAEERREARKHPTKKKTARLGRFEGKGGMAKYGMVQCSFQAFSMGRQSSRRKSRGRKRPSTRFTADGNADRTRVFGLLDAEKYRCHKKALCQYTVPQIPQSAVFKGKT